MDSPLSFLAKLLSRWSRQEETALRQLSGKTAGKRLFGLAKSRRIQAKFFLLAAAPMALCIISDQLGWSRGVIWHTWFWLSVAWALAIFAIGFAVLWRALLRSLERKRQANFRGPTRL